MSYVVLAVALVIAGFALRTATEPRLKQHAWLAWSVWVVAVLSLAMTSFVVVDQEKIGHLRRVYLAANMKPGQVIAFEGEKGPQARILRPGFHFIPFVAVLHDAEQIPIVHVPQGKYGVLTAKDGVPLGGDEFIAKG